MIETMEEMGSRFKIGKALSFQVLNHPDHGLAGPRLARLCLSGRQNVETPNFFALTSRGTIPHITPDVIQAHSRVSGVHMAVEDFIEKATNGQPPILNSPGIWPVHTFAALPKSIFTLLAPRRTPAVSAPNGNTNTAISVFTSTGFQVVSNKSYINYIQSLRPDIAIGLADIAYGSVPGTKRASKMGDRTQQWLTELLNEKSEGQAVFAPVLPLDINDQMEYLNWVAEEVTDKVSGLAFYDSNLLPDISGTTSAFELPRLSLDEPLSPLHIIRQISLGMDLFTIPFVGFATDSGIALTFSFPRPRPDDELASKGTSPLPLGIDMWSPDHSVSLRPLSASCTCHACVSHHRAYIQHLLSAKEMLGWVLLQIHNHHIISEFFSSVRKSIHDNTFETNSAEFAQKYESELPEKSGQGPRVRGYHFKSDGGESKRNKAAWGNLGSDDQKMDRVPVPDESSDRLEEKRFAENVRHLRT